MSTDYPTDSELHAYVDLELAASRAAAIEELAANDVALAERINRVRALKESLTLAFDDTDETVNDRFSHQALEKLAQNKKGSTLLPYAAAAMVVGSLFVGYFAGQWQRLGADSLQDESWIEQAVSYQDMYTKSTIAAIETREQNLELVTNTLSDAIGGAFVIPDLNQMGLVFKRGQVLQSGNRAVVQLAYLDSATGEPVAVCITRLKDGAVAKSTAFEAGQSRSVNYVHWQDTQFEFVLVGRQTPALLNSLAESTKAQQHDALG